MSTGQRNKLALVYGLMLGVIYIVISCAVNLLVANWSLFDMVKLAGYAFYFVLIGVLATRIKKANGGFIEFREVFGAVFIMILLSEFLYFTFNYIYVLYVDPQFLIKCKEASIKYMMQSKMPDAKIQEASRNLDQTIAESRTFNLARNLSSYLQFVVLDSLFGLLVCLIVRKPGQSGT